MFQVEKVISTQLALMRIEQQTTAGEASSCNKILGHSFANLAQPGPSGLSGRATKTEHSVPGKFLIFKHKFSYRNHLRVNLFQL
jgi:hypothetical protein